MKLKAPDTLSGLGKGFSFKAKLSTLGDYSLPELNTETDKEKLEKRAKQGVIGTLPERIIWKWLEDRGHLFTTQSAQFGGRLTVGGAVVDFVVYTLTGKPVVIRVQGEYWHGPAFPGRREKDDDQAARLRQMGYLVIDLEERDIYSYTLDGHLTRLIERQL